MKKLNTPSPTLENTHRPLLGDVVADRVERLIGGEGKVSMKDRATLYMSHFQSQDSTAIMQELEKNENSIVKRRSLIHILISRFETEPSTLFPFLTDFYWQEQRLEITQEILNCFMRSGIIENKKTRNIFCKKGANSLTQCNEKSIEKFILLGGALAPFSCHEESFMLLNQIAQKHHTHTILYSTYLQTFAEGMKSLTARQLLNATHQILGLWSQCYRHALYTRIEQAMHEENFVHFGKATKEEIIHALMAQGLSETDPDVLTLLLKITRHRNTIHTPKTREA